MAHYSAAQKVHLWCSISRNFDLSPLPGSESTTSHASKAGGGFFSFFLRNSLIRPDLTKGIQGNPRLFPWILLDFLAANSRFG
jgi:hypothetical protein